MHQDGLTYLTRSANQFLPFSSVRFIRKSATYQHGHKVTEFHTLSDGEKDLLTIGTLIVIAICYLPLLFGLWHGLKMKKQYRSALQRLEYDQTPAGKIST